MGSPLVISFLSEDRKPAQQLHFHMEFAIFAFELGGSAVRIRLIATARRK